MNGEVWLIVRKYGRKRTCLIESKPNGQLDIFDCSCFFFVSYWFVRFFLFYFIWYILIWIRLGHKKSKETVFVLTVLDIWVGFWHVEDLQKWNNNNNNRVNENRHQVKSTLKNKTTRTVWKQDRERQKESETKKLRTPFVQNQNKVGHFHI